MFIIKYCFDFIIIVFYFSVIMVFYFSVIIGFCCEAIIRFGFCFSKIYIGVGRIVVRMRVLF